MADAKVLDPRFADRLHERAQGTITYEDFLQTVGDFVVVRNGRVDDSDPDTRIATKMFDFVRRLSESKKPLARRR